MNMHVEILWKTYLRNMDDTLGESALLGNFITKCVSLRIDLKENQIHSQDFEASLNFVRSLELDGQDQPAATGEYQ